MGFGFPTQAPGSLPETPLSVANGGTGASTAAGARTNLSALSSAAGAVGTANLANDAATPAKIAARPERGYFVLGRNGAGAVTCTGALVGDKVSRIVNLAAGPGSDLDRTLYFESTITVANQIQQTNAANLSAEALQIDLIRSGS